MICLISLDVSISLRVNLSAISAMSFTGTSLNGSLNAMIDWPWVRAVFVKNLRRISSVNAETMGSIVLLL